MSITITRPEFLTVNITPRPAIINTAFTISIEIIDKEIILMPEERFSGEFYSGEDDLI